MKWETFKKNHPTAAKKFKSFHKSYNKDAWWPLKSLNNFDFQYKTKTAVEGFTAGAVCGEDELIYRYRKWEAVSF